MPTGRGRKVGSNAQPRRIKKSAGVDIPGAACYNKQQEGNEASHRANASVFFQMENPPVGSCYGRAFTYFFLLPRPKAVSTNPMIAITNDNI